jgi:DNA polymerase III alpha subunit
MHGVPVLPVDVNHSEWDCTFEPNTNDAPRPDVQPKWDWGKIGPAVRLGFRRVKGFREPQTQRIISARRQVGCFRSIEHFCRMTNLPPSALRRLAEADAFGSLGLSRREALWKVMNQHHESSPLFDWIDDEREQNVALPKMPMLREVTTDYHTAGLSLKRHPVALIRDRLNELHITTAAELMNLPAGRWVKVAGIVLIRQRPGTASGIVFETLEDETGVVNLIIRPDIFDQYRAAARHAALVQADGYVERQGQVIHVMTKRMFDRTNLIQAELQSSRDFH